LYFVDCRLFQRGHKSIASFVELKPLRFLGITVKAHLTPVNPAFFEKDLNSIAQSFAPSISYIECGISLS